MSNEKWKWICLVLTAIIIFGAVWIYRDYRIVNLSQKSDSLARTIASLNNNYNFPQGVNMQLNVILKDAGYSGLQKVIRVPAVVDTTNG